MRLLQSVLHPQLVQPHSRCSSFVKGILYLGVYSQPCIRVRANAVLSVQQVEGETLHIAGAKLFQHLHKSLPEAHHVHVPTMDVSRADEAQVCANKHSTTSSCKFAAFIDILQCRAVKHNPRSVQSVAKHLLGRRKIRTAAILSLGRAVLKRKQRQAAQSCSRVRKSNVICQLTRQPNLQIAQLMPSSPGMSNLPFTGSWPHALDIGVHCKLQTVCLISFIKAHMQGFQTFSYTLHAVLNLQVCRSSKLSMLTWSP